MSFDSVKDSGSRQEWDTGSRRDTREGKGRFDLIPPTFLRRLARHLENGAVKYGDRNWELGQPLSRYLDSGMRHIVNLLNGDVDEDHAAAVAWNAMAFLCTAEWIKEGKLPRELDDLGYVDNLEDAKQTAIEEEADEFATEVLAPLTRPGWHDGGWIHEGDFSSFDYAVPQRFIVGVDVAGMDEEELKRQIQNATRHTLLTTPEPPRRIRIEATRALLGEPTIQVGDTVRIAVSDFGGSKWVGFEAEVLGTNDVFDRTYLRPLSDRPDGYGNAKFYWPTEKLEVVAPMISQGAPGEEAPSQPYMTIRLTDEILATVKDHWHESLLTDDPLEAAKHATRGLEVAVQAMHEAINRRD